MPIPAGQIWLRSGADADCSGATGSCANGPCGPGEITECPDFWTDTATHTVAFVPGWGSIKVGGRTISPGQTFRFPRSLALAPSPFEYPVEYFGGADI